MVVGSPGGSAIINYVAKTLVGVLDWGLDIQAAIAAQHGQPQQGHRAGKGTALEALAPALEAMGIRCASPSFPAASTAS